MGYDKMNIYQLNLFVAYLFLSSVWNLFYNEDDWLKFEDGNT